jgi:hypothetical protein
LTSEPLSQTPDRHFGILTLLYTKFSSTMSIAAINATASQDPTTQLLTILNESSLVPSSKKRKYQHRDWFEIARKVRKEEGQKKKDFEASLIVKSRDDDTQKTKGEEQVLMYEKNEAFYL